MGRQGIHGDRARGRPPDAAMLSAALRARSRRRSRPPCATSTSRRAPPLPAHDLDLALLEALRPDREPVGDADQVGVLELDARPLVAVVEQHVDARRRAAPRRGARPPRLVRDVLRVQHGDHDLEGRDVDRPDDAVRRRGSARPPRPSCARCRCRSEPITIGTRLAVLVEHVRAERLAVARAELEDVADLDRLAHARAARRTSGQPSPARDLAQVEPARRRAMSRATSTPRRWKSSWFAPVVMSRRPLQRRVGEDAACPRRRRRRGCPAAAPSARADLLGVRRPRSRARRSRRRASARAARGRRAAARARSRRRARRRAS